MGFWGFAVQKKEFEMEKRESDVEKGTLKGIGFWGSFSLESSGNTVRYPPLSGVIALASNIFSAIGVITINKWLFVNEEFRYGLCISAWFNFFAVLTLSLMHFIVTCGVLHVMLRLGYFEWKKLPLQEVAKLSGTCTLGTRNENHSHQ